MICCNQSNVLADTLSDPMIQAVMAADGVDPQELEQTLRTMLRHANICSQYEHYAQK